MYNLMKVVGQQPVAEYFEGAVKSNRLHHAYLFIGMEGVGKCAMALEWARALNCTGKKKKPCYECESCRKIGVMKHQDVHIYSPTPPGATKEDSVYDALSRIRSGIAEDPYRRAVLSPAWVFRVNWIQEIINMTSYKKTGTGTRVFILLNVEQMNPDAANRFLKTLEEPPDGVLFILTCGDLTQVLPTIRSRCIPVHFAPLAEGIITEILKSKYGIPEDEAGMSARFAGGSLSQAVDFAEQGMGEKKKLAVRILQTGLALNAALIPQTAEEISKMNKDYPVRDILQLLLFSVNRALIEKAAESPEGRSGAADSDDLVGQLMNFPGELLQGVAGEVEKSIDLIAKNVYLNLILTVLIQKIRKVLGSGEYTRN